MMAFKKYALNFKRRHFEKNLKHWLFSNHCFCRLIQCISLKLGTFVQWPFFVITNKSAKICSVFGDTVIQSLRSEKNTKSRVVPILRQEKLANLFLVFLARLETLLKTFRSYSLTNSSKNEAFKHFLVNFIKRLP